MDRSPGFGSIIYDLIRPIQTRFRFGSIPYIVLNLAIYNNSLDRSTKSTISHIYSALSACKHRVSGSLSLPSRGSFHLSLTVLLHYRSPSSIQPYGVVPTYSYEIPRASYYSGYYHVSLSFIYWTFTVYGMLSQTFLLDLLNQLYSPLPQMYYYFWFRLLLFRSPLLQESSFLSFPVTTQMFQFITFPLICYFTHILITNHFLLVEFPHSDICGYNGYLLLPTAFRSLSRPSSALGAQAFSLRSQQLNLLASSKLSFILCYIVINFSTVFAFLGFTVFQLLPLNCFLVLLVYLYLIYLYIFQCANLNFFQFRFGGLKWNRTIDLTLIRRAL